MTRTTIQQVLKFSSVGALAACTHFLVVICLVQLGILTPLVANVVAFLVAFNVSYFGHSRWTFYSATSNYNHRNAYKLFIVASISFITNESLFYLLMKYAHLPYPMALAITLVLVATGTFIASKRWAFSS